MPLSSLDLHTHRAQHRQQLSYLYFIPHPSVRQLLVPPPPNPPLATVEISTGHSRAALHATPVLSMPISPPIWALSALYFGTLASMLAEVIGLAGAAPSDGTGLRAYTTSIFF